MKPIKNIELAFQCTEKWKDMKPCEGGRHCTVCNKTVYDFSSASLEEFQQITRANNYDVCGQFRKEQMVYRSPSFFAPSAKWLSALVLFFGFSSCENDQIIDNTSTENNYDDPHAGHTLGSPARTIEAVTNEKVDAIKERPKAKQNSSDLKENDDTEFLGVIDFPMPEYKYGGEAGMYQFVQDNLHLSDSVRGRVVTEITVDTIGQVSDVKIIRGIDDSTNAEVKRVLSLLEFTKANNAFQFILPISIHEHDDDAEKNTPPIK
jgi:hypothetical protein